MKTEDRNRICKAVQEIHDITETDIEDIVDCLIGFAWDDENAGEIKFQMRQGSKTSESVACKNFSYIDVTTEGYEGTLNLFCGDLPVAFINNTQVANKIRELLKPKQKTSK